MIEEFVAQWHAYLRGEFPGGLDALLDDDVVFYSPIVFTPQRGRDITKAYLVAAGQNFPGDPKEPGASTGGSFRYTKEVMSGDTAVLEFETVIDTKYVNGVDIITFNSEGRIIEFRVMIRPLQAVNLIHQKMGATLAAMDQAPH